MKRVKLTSGHAMLLIAMIHNLVGVIIGGPYLLAMISEGWVATLEDDMNAPLPMVWRAVCFWFIIAGFLMAIIGHLMHAFESRLNEPCPPDVGALLVGISILGGLALPASGFWLVTVLGVWMIFRHRRFVKRPRTA